MEILILTANKNYAPLKLIYSKQPLIFDTTFQKPTLQATQLLNVNKIFCVAICKVPETYRENGGCAGLAPPHSQLKRMKYLGDFSAIFIQRLLLNWQARCTCVYVVINLQVG